jgi:hypothetical protein
MIHLENAHAVAQCASIRIGIEPGAEYHELPDAAIDGGGQSVFREAGPHRYEHAHPASGWALFSLASDGIGIFAQDAQGKWIGEDAAVFQYLMSGAVKSCRSSRPAWLCALHT